MGAVNHLSLFYTKGASSGSLRRIWMRKNHSHTAYEWPDPQFYKGDLTGAVRVNGRDITKMPLYEIAENTGSVFQNPRSQFLMWIRTASFLLPVKTLGIPRMKSSQE